MKDWLDTQNRIEKDLLIELGRQCRDLLDLLMPQIRLAVTINLDFDLSSGVAVKGEGSVTFPAKKATIELELSEE